MADQTASPANKEESPTTREEMDFSDHEHEQETGRLSPQGHETATANPLTTKPSPSPKHVAFAEEEAPPAKPPRPMSPHQQAEHTLIEAFPSIDAKVVKAVLTASAGRVEPAFNALLGMSDPDFTPEEPAPRQPPRPTQHHQTQNRAPQSQLEQDEVYARQLAEHYNTRTPYGQTPPRGHSYNQREPARRGPNAQPRPAADDDDDREHSFFDDDLPEIGRNIQQGFAETQKRVNGWINTFKKRIDGEDDDDDLYSSGASAPQGRQNFGPSQSEQLYGIRKNAEAQRRSVEQQRYDADPHVLDDAEFSRLELRDEEAPPPQPPRTTSRKPTNPDLFKPHSSVPPPSGPIDEVDAADRSADPNKAKKWQPLTSVAPNPEDENDPFALGDDDEGGEKGEDLRKEDTERLKGKARESVDAGDGGGKKALEESGRSGSLGTRDEVAEALLAEKKE